MKFTSDFWKSLFDGLDTKLNFISTYHLWKHMHNNRLNQVIEDMLCMYVKVKYLHLGDFAYNNGHHASLGHGVFT